MFTEEQLSDDETGKACVFAAYHAINRDHVKGYCSYAFSSPNEMSEAERKKVMEAVLAFATLGWSAFHVINKGQPLKDAPGAKGSRSVKNPKPKEKADDDSRKRSKRRQPRNRSNRGTDSGPKRTASVGRS